MAKLCVGRRFHCYFCNRLSVLAILFGLTLSSQSSIREISELVEDFEDNSKKYFFENHDIVRRDAGTVQPNISMVSPSPISAIPPTPGTFTPRISSSFLKQFASSTTPRSSSVKPSKTVIPMSKTTSFATANVPTTLTPVTSKKPSTPTTERKTTSKGTTPTAAYRSTSYVEDHHKYYRSQYYSNGRQWWFNLDDGTHGSKKPKFHNELSKNIIFSDLLKTSFIFPYYGHLVNNVTITNKGYLFLGERLHKFNASAQYAAPLMADFGADLHDKTSIRYIDTGDRLTVEWANMRVRNESPDIQFSFQCSIFKNGTLIFAYKNIPKPVDKLRTNDFFVRVGLSDTYRRETIRQGPVIIDGIRYRAVRYIIYYLYDRVQLPKNKVVNGAAFVLIPFPNCVMFKSCDTCLNTQEKFDCRWCPAIKRCSDGIDRHRSEWETAGCFHDSVNSCSSSADNSGVNGGVIAVIVIVLVLVIIALAWYVYAYSHPQTKSGLCLIKYGNPTKWCRNSSGERQNTSTDGRISFKTMAFESNA